MNLHNISQAMFKWAKDEELYCVLKLTSRKRDAFTRYILDIQPESFKVVHKFMKAFPVVKTMKRLPSYDPSNLRYEKILEGKDSSLIIDLFEVSELPPSCKVEYEEVWVEEKVVPEHVEERHLEKRAKIVCSNDKEE